jgi:mannitol operon repressor
MKKKTPRSIPELSAGLASFLEELQAQTDRGAALLGPSLLEDLLGALLRSALINDSDCVENLLGRSRPVESFSARIDLVYCIGLIGRKVFDDLNQIRLIRNEFAHEPAQLDFNEQSIAARCNNLTALPWDQFSRPLQPRERFNLTVLQLANLLMLKGLNTSHLPPGKDLGMRTLFKI